MPHNLKRPIAPTTAHCASSTQRLDLAGNNLKKLPSAVGSLAALTFLDVSGNGLADLEVVRQLGSLEELVADDNAVVEPPDFSHMPNLRRISMNRNQLTEVRRLANLLIRRLLVLCCLPSLRGAPCILPR
jgi:Leucine-rich repeat (LRR) protein